MSSGQRFKWQGSHISILTEFQSNSPGKVISGITAANPPVVSSTAHGFVNGDVVYISGVVGMTEVNSKAFIVANKTTGTFELYGVKAVGYSAYTSGGTIDNSAFSEFCELTNWSNSGDQAPEIPATTICSDETEYEIGLSGQGSVALSFNFAPISSTVQVALHSWRLSGDMMALKVQLPKNGGTMVYLGFVTQESNSAGNGALWTATANVRLTGSRLDVAAA